MAGRARAVGRVATGERVLPRPLRARRGGSGVFQHPVIERVAHELGAGRARRLALDVRAMRLDGADAEVELLGDLAVGEPERDEPEDLELALGQLVGWTGRRGGLRGQAGTEARIQVGAAGDGDPDRLDQLLVGRVLEDVAGGAGTK